MKKKLFNSITSFVLIIFASVTISSAQSISPDESDALAYINNNGNTSVEIKESANNFNSDYKTLNLKEANDTATLKNKTFTMRNDTSLPYEQKDFNAKLLQNIKYPDLAINKGIEGEVVVLCTIDTDGSVSDVVILKDIGGDCGTEVSNAIRRMKFEPAVQNGYAVRYSVSIPVVFRLHNSSL